MTNKTKSMRSMRTGRRSALAGLSAGAMGLTLSLAVGAGSAALPGAASAQDKAVKILVGFPPGAGLDAMTRMVADKMRVTLGQNVIVENRPGAGGRIVMDALKAAPADTIKELTKNDGTFMRDKSYDYYKAEPYWH